MPHRISQYEWGQNLVALFKGEWGTGKTVAAGSFPGPSYFLSTDGKVGSLKLFYPHAEIEYDIFTNFWDVFERLEELQERCPYRTVVLDGLTPLSRMAIQHSIQFRPVERAKSRKPEEEKDVTGRKRGGLLLPEIEDYGAESMGLWQSIFKLKDIGAKFNCNVILTAHVLNVDTINPITGRTTSSRTLLTGGKKIAAEIPGEFDHIFHFKAQVTKGFTEEEPTAINYIAVTHHGGDDFARTAFPLPREIDFTDSNFYDILMRHLHEHEAAKD